MPKVLGYFTSTGDHIEVYEITPAQARAVISSCLDNLGPQDNDYPKELHDPTISQKGLLLWATQFLNKKPTNKNGSSKTWCSSLQNLIGCGSKDAN